MKDSLFVGSCEKRSVAAHSPRLWLLGLPWLCSEATLGSVLKVIHTWASAELCLAPCLLFRRVSLLALSCVSHSSVIAQGAAVHLKSQQHGSVMPRKCCFFSEWVSLSLTFPSNYMLLLGKHVPVKAGLLPQEDCAEAAVLAWAQLPAPWTQTGTVTGFRLEPSSPIGLHSGDPWCFSSPCGWASLTSMMPTWRH